METERTERLFDLLGDIDDALIAAAAPKPVTAPTKPNPWKKWVGAVACLCLAAIIGTVAWRMNDTVGTELPDQPKYPPAETIEVEAQEGNHLMSAFPITPQTTAWKNRSFTIGTAAYTCHNTNQTISPTLLGDRLGTTATKADSANAVNLTYYRIQGISEQCAVAVIFEGEENIYVYANTNYAPTTMADLFADMNLSEYLTFSDNKVTYTYAEHDLLYTTVYETEPNFVITHLLSPMMSQEIHKINRDSILPASQPAQIKIEAHMDMLGYRSANITIYRNGYLTLYLYGAYYIFTVDEAQLRALLQTLDQQDPDPVQTFKTVPDTYDVYRDPTVASGFDRITIDGITYRFRASMYGVDEDRIGEQLGEMKAADTMYAPTVTYYRLADVSTECGIAVRFPSNGMYYAYYNPDYIPETLGDLIRDMGLTRYLTFGNTHVYHQEGTARQIGVFDPTDPALLWIRLLDNASAKNVTLPNSKKPSEQTVRVEIPIMLPLFSGDREYTLWLTEDGNLRIDLLDSYFVFALDSDTVASEQYIAEMLRYHPDRLTLSAEEASPYSDFSEREKNKLYSLYRSMETNGVLYHASNTSVKPSRIGRTLGSAFAVGADEKKDAIRRAPVTYYAIQGESPLEAVAVRFEGTKDTSYYRYYTYTYCFDTLGEFLELTDWHNTASIRSVSTRVRGSTSVGYVTMTFSDMELMQTATLFSATDAPNIFQSDRIRSGGETITIDAGITGPNGESVALQLRVWSYGYLSVLINGDRNKPLCFHIGTEHAQEFFRYIWLDCADRASVTDGILKVQENETTEQAIARTLAENFEQVTAE